MYQHHQLLLESMVVISKVEAFWNGVILEMPGIHKEQSTVNRNIGLRLDSSWTPLLQLMSCQ